jgi:hypothetical protein
MAIATSITIAIITTGAIVATATCTMTAMNGSDVLCISEARIEKESPSRETQY